MLSLNALVKSFVFATLFLVVTLSPETAAKRYINAKDDEVHYTINKSAKDIVIPISKKLKVLVWNLYKGEKKSFVEDFKRITADKDILLLQEVMTDKRMMDVFNEDALRQYTIATSFFDSKKDWARSGVATASRYNPMTVNWLRSHYTEPLVKTPKMISVATFDIEGTDKDLMTLSIHAVNFVSAKKLKHQVQAAANFIKHHDGPVIFGGDFNTWSKKKMKKVRQVLESVGLKEVPFGRGRMETFGRVLDHVFVRGVEVLKSKVHANVEGSDHKALELELQIH